MGLGGFGGAGPEGPPNVTEGAGQAILSLLGSATNRVPAPLFIIPCHRSWRAARQNAEKVEKGWRRGRCRREGDRVCVRTCRYLYV